MLFFLFGIVLRTYKNYCEQDLIRTAKEVTSMAMFLKQLGLKPSGGSYANMFKRLVELNVNCSHWTGSAWSKAKQLKPLGAHKSKTWIKSSLVNARGRYCENCGLAVWLGSGIPLEVHHVDGNTLNNEISNLRLLCCNCHALTPNWRKRNS